MDGGQSLRFSPKYPKKILQLNNPGNALKETQKEIYALDLNMGSFVPSVDDGINITKIPVKEITNESCLRFAASKYDHQNNIIRPGITGTGKTIITFDNVLKHKVFPLPEILETLMDVGMKEMGNPIEIEFAANLEMPVGMPKIFNFLQIRPIVDNDQSQIINIDNILNSDSIIISESALGNGMLKGLQDIIYIRPESFKAANNEKIVSILDNLNNKFVKSARNYILIGPGRWGSTDPWLGIPIKWQHISQARVIVESGLPNYRIDPSQGTHFFQNITSFRVGYFTINPFINDGFYDIDFLRTYGSVYEDEYLRHIHFESPLKVMIDGRIHKGVILKPEDKNENDS
ncbi:MAG: hypothetical protein E4G95_04110 [Bacteroidia bacterium]|nr:MAG: hypothetical protein E4G95_04110 [Bacteroidia bacterium]